MLTYFSNFFIKVKQKLNNFIYLTYRKKYNISPAFRFNGINIMFYGDGVIECGPDSYIGDYSTVQAYLDCKVSIGKGSQISHNVRIYTSSDNADQDFSQEHRIIKTGNVTIGDYVWNRN